MADEDDETADEAEVASTSVGDEDDGPSSTADETERDDLRQRAIARRSGRWWTRPRRRRVAVVAGIVVLALVWQWGSSGGGAALDLIRDGGDRGRTPAQTVSGFYHAQAAGDCERLLDLLTEESWSDGGRLNRRQFLDRCAEALEGYQPNVGDVQVRLVDEEGDPASGGDRAMVDIETPPGVPLVYDDEMPTGRLAREDGEWRVQTDPVVLHLGRSVEETVTAYAEAYNTGDCDTITDLLSEEVWSQEGQLDRGQFLEACGRAADRRQERVQPAIDLRALEVSIDDDRQATATIAHADHPLMSPPRILDEEGEAATLVRDGFAWRIEGIEDRTGLPSWAPFRSVRRAELQTTLVGSDLTRDGEACHRWLDHAVDVEDDVGAWGIRREFGGCYLYLTVYQLGDADEARAFAEARATEILEDPPPTAEDLLDNSTDITPEEAARYAATYRPNQSAPVPGFADAFGLRTRCDVDGCGQSEVVVAHEDVVIHVEYQVDDNLTFAVGVLRSQLEASS